MMTMTALTAGHSARHFIGTGQVSEFPLTYTIILKELDHPVHPQPQPRDWALDPS